MSLLTICQAVADEIKITRPSAIVSSVEPNIQSLYRFANRAGNDLMKMFPWQVLRSEQTFTSVASETQTAILPSDFDRIVPETFWDRSSSTLISGPISAVEWAGLKATSYANTSIRKFAYRGGNILITPTMGAGSSLAFEYVSNKWAASSGGTAQTSFTADTDVGRIDEELIIKAVKLLYLDSEGLPMVSALADFNSYYEKVTRNEQSSAGVVAAGDIFGSGRHFTGAPPVSTGLNI